MLSLVGLCDAHTMRSAGTISASTCPLPSILSSWWTIWTGNPGPQAAKALRQLGAECTPEALAAMHQALVGAQIEALESFRLGLEPPLPEKPLAARGRRRQGGGVSFREAAERHVADRMRDPNAAWTAQTRAQNEATFRLFGDHVGRATLASIGRDDVAEFLSTVARLHRDDGRSPAAKGLPLAELLMRYSGPPCLSNKTLNRRLLDALGAVPVGSPGGAMCRRDRPNPFSEQMRDGRRQSLSALLGGGVERAVQRLGFRGAALCKRLHKQGHRCRQRPDLG